MSPASDAVPGTDRTVLRTAAYADSSKLDDRRNIYAYRRPEFDLVDSVLGHLELPPGARVLDMGCGPGTYLARLGEDDGSWRLTGFDLSTGMLAATRAAGISAVACGDATALPFAGDAFDAVMANHMLYHVADIGLAVREARRVLVDGGTFLAVANATAHLAELDALLAEVSGRDGWWRPSHRFTTDNGRPFLDAAFGSVELMAFRGELHVPDAAPVMAFAHSMRELSGEGYGDAEWDELMADFEVAVRAVLRRDGEFVTRTDTGVFVCR